MKKIMTLVLCRTDIHIMQGVTEQIVFFYLALKMLITVQIPGIMMWIIMPMFRLGAAHHPSYFTRPQFIQWLIFCLIIPSKINLICALKLKLSLLESELIKVIMSCASGLDCPYTCN